MTVLDTSPTGRASATVPDAWVPVCRVADLIPDRGVAALVGGEAVAVFRCWPDGELFAIGNVCPFSGASVLSRGIVGSVGDRVVVASPIFKQRFDLATGVALDDPSIAVPTYAVRVDDGVVHVAPGPSLPGS
jgi:nitrite reductase (NADH) small subunit